MGCSIKAGVFMFWGELVWLSAVHAALIGDTMSGVGYLGFRLALRQC